MTLSDTIYMSNVSLKQRIIDLLMVQKKKKKPITLKKKNPPTNQSEKFNERANKFNIKFIAL